MNEKQLVKNLREWLGYQINHHQTILDNDREVLSFPKLNEENRKRVETSIEICTFRINFLNKQLNNL